MVIVEPTEASPLLTRLSGGDARTGARRNTSSILERLSFSSTRADLECNELELPELPPFSILMEVIGAQHLCFNQSNSDNGSNSLMEAYCVVQYGTHTLHRTLPFRGNNADQTLSRAKRFGQALTHSLRRVAQYDDTLTLAQNLQNPIWTLQHNALWSLDVISRDVDNHKAVVINLWAKPLQATDVHGNVKPSSNKKMIQPTLLGKVKIHLHDLVAHCTGKRIELPLVDNLDREVTHTNTSGKETKSLLAFRCRIASPADLEFVRRWNDPSASIINRSNSLRIITDNVWDRAHVIQQASNYQNAILLTDIPENQVQGAFLSTAVKNAIKRADGKVCVKPGPDPLLVNNKQPRPKSLRVLSPTSSQMYLTSEELKLEALKPSRHWVQAGSREQSLGRLYVEILSCHDLPNVDIGESLGNKTDAFVSLIYGDTMVQTDLIDDELSPHWMPWTQRAFAMNMSKDWPNPYSQVLYIGVFGYKRKPLRRHKPIGRIEIHPLHFQRDTLYELEYNLYKDSHKTHREAQGRIRLRLRIEMDDERAALLSSMSSSLPWNSPENASIYINTKTKKSWAVAQFTACGEYENGEKFSLAVLQGYIDEIVQGYLRRLIHTLQDGTRSLVFWQPHNQLRIPIPGCGVFVFPLYSLLCFIMGLFMVEHPQFIPGMLCLAASLFLLTQMAHRNRSPSPWKRCNSFLHYCRILIGQSTLQFEHIAANEGWEETRAQEEDLKKRMESDQLFFQKKEAVEKELEELEHSTHMDTKSKDIIHLELLVVLGKVQAIVGGEYRSCCLGLDCCLAYNYP
jgi:C2 domain